MIKDNSPWTDTDEYHKFFEGLAKNNKKEWFDKNCCYF